MALTECQDQLKKSRDQLVDTEVKLFDLQTWFAIENEGNSEADANLRLPMHRGTQCSKK